MTQGSMTPKNIQCSSIVVDLDFHPKKNILATGDIEGECIIHDYNPGGETSRLFTLSHHRKAVRALTFSPCGSILHTVSKDKSLQSVDVSTGIVVNNLQKCHRSALYSVLSIDDNIIATGDEDGGVKVWDLRYGKAVMDMQECSEFISDMTINNYKRFLLATSGDGTLIAFDIRKHKVKLQSELMDSELLSIAIVKRGAKVVCGTGEGTLEFFNWGEWGNISDRYPGHPMSIDCMVQLNDDILITGSMDGCVRAVHLQPNRILGKVGEHKDLPVENIALSHCKQYLASCTHDETVRFWETEKWADRSVETTREGRDAERTQIREEREKSSFFADFNVDVTTGVVYNSDDSDSDSDDEDGEKKKKKEAEAAKKAAEQEEAAAKAKDDAEAEEEDDDESMSDIDDYESSENSVIDDIDTDDISDLTTSDSD